LNPRRVHLTKLVLQTQAIQEANQKVGKKLQDGVNFFTGNKVNPFISENTRCTNVLARPPYICNRQYNPDDPNKLCKPCRKIVNDKFVDQLPVLEGQKHWTKYDEVVQAKGKQFEVSKELPASVRTRLNLTPRGIQKKSINKRNNRRRREYNDDNYDDDDGFVISDDDDEPLILHPFDKGYRPIPSNKIVTKSGKKPVSKSQLENTQIDDNRMDWDEDDEPDLLSRETAKLIIDQRKKNT